MGLSTGSGPEPRSAVSSGSGPHSTSSDLLSAMRGTPPPWTLEGLADPHAWFTEALAGDPVVYDPRADLWHIFRYAEVRDLLRDPLAWSVAKRLERVPPDQRMVRLLTSDPPAHAELRGHFAAAYRPRRIAALEPWIRRRAAQLVNAGLDAGTFDVVAEIAVPLTKEVIGEVIGVPAGDLEACARLAIRNPLGTTEYGPDGEAFPVIWMGAGEPENNRHFSEYFRDLIAERRRRPRDDLVSALAGMALEPSDHAGLLNIGALLDEQFGAGQNTTVHLIGTLLAQLIDAPDVTRRLRDDRSLLRTAIEEGLRWCPPLQARPRISTMPVEITGTVIPAGSVGLAWTQAANLDPRQFPEPLCFDVARRDNPHLSFGFGEHFCLGAALARLQVRVLLEEWLTRVGDCERTGDGPLEWLDSYMLRGLKRLDVRAAPARGSPPRPIPPF